MRTWQRLWLVLTLLWGVPLALLLRDPGTAFEWGTYLRALAIVVVAPSLALYGILWAIARFFFSSER